MAFAKALSLFGMVKSMNLVHPYWASNLEQSVTSGMAHFLGSLNHLLGTTKKFLLRSSTENFYQRNPMFQLSGVVQNSRRTELYHEVMTTSYLLRFTSGNSVDGIFALQSLVFLSPRKPGWGEANMHCPWFLTLREAAACSVLVVWNIAL